MHGDLELSETEIVVRGREAELLIDESAQILELELEELEWDHRDA
jgi:hypothetical protein